MFDCLSLCLSIIAEMCVTLSSICSVDSQTFYLERERGGGSGEKVRVKGENCFLQRVDQEKGVEGRVRIKATNQLHLRSALG